MILLSLYYTDIEAVRYTGGLFHMKKMAEELGKTLLINLIQHGLMYWKNYDGVVQ